MSSVDCGNSAAGERPPLRAGEAHAGAILDAALDAVVTIDHLGRVLEFNPAAETTFGYAREDVLGRELAELIIPPESREAHRRGLARWSEHGAGPGAGGVLGRRVEALAMRAGGEVFPAELAISRVDVPGPPVFTACIRDVGDQKRAEDLLRAAEHRYRQLVEHLPLVLYVAPLDPRAPLDYVSPEIEALVGYPADEWLGRPELYEQSLHPEDRSRVLAAKRDAYGSGAPLRLEYRMFAADGRVVWVEDQSVLVEPPDGAPYRQGFSLDVTERVNAIAERERLLERELAQRDFMSAILDTVSIVIVVDRDGRIVRFNRAAEELTGYTFAEVAGRRGDMFLPPEEQVAVQSRITNVTPEARPTGENHWVSRDGGRHLLSWTNRAILDADGEVAYVVSSAIDITHRARAEQAIAEQNERLHRLAFRDQLTGLANRTLFTERLQARSGASADAALLFIDLDDFKRVNDTLGHPAGDALLRAIAARLSGLLAPGETIARLGGDEFAILLDEAAGTDTASALAERVLASLRAPFAIAGRELFVTASVGIVVGRDADELLRAADVALYRAKAVGKAQYVVYDETMDGALLGRLELIADLRRAQVDREFVLHYQPVVDLRTGELEGVEALVRWQHPTRGLLPPGMFVPAAEETGLILDLGQWVLTEACRQVAHWRATLGGTPLSVNVNVSARQLLSPTFVGDVRRALDDAGLEPGALTLELTESTLAEARDETAAVLDALKELGVGVALDDFGTGYSSLSLLQHVPVDTLKIDRSFVDRLGRKGEEGALVRAILEVGKALGASVVAEGIETDAQLAALRTLGCALGQGFYFARPLEAARVEELVARVARPAEAA